MQNFQPKRKLNQWHVSLFFIILIYFTHCPGLHYFVEILWYYETSRAAIMLLSSLMERKVCYDQNISMAYCSYFSGECWQLAQDCCPHLSWAPDLRNNLPKMQYLCYT